MTDATIGYGTQVRVGRGETPVWTALAEIKDVTWPVAEADDIEATNMESPNRTKEFISGLTDNGEVVIPMNWVPGSPTDVLLADLQSTGELVQVEFTSNEVGATPEIYVGYVRRYSRTSPVNDVQMAEAAFRISGLVA